MHAYINVDISIAFATIRCSHALCYVISYSTFTGFHFCTDFYLQAKKRSKELHEKSARLMNIVRM